MGGRECPSFLFCLSSFSILLLTPSSQRTRRRSSNEFHDAEEGAEPNDSGEEETSCADEDDGIVATLDSSPPPPPPAAAAAAAAAPAAGGKEGKEGKATTETSKIAEAGQVPSSIKESTEVAEEKRATEYGEPEAAAAAAAAVPPVAAPPKASDSAKVSSKADGATPAAEEVALPSTVSAKEASVEKVPPAESNSIKVPGKGLSLQPPAALPSSSSPSSSPSSSSSGAKSAPSARGGKRTLREGKAKLRDKPRHGQSEVFDGNAHHNNDSPRREQKGKGGSSSSSSSGGGGGGSAAASEPTMQLGTDRRGNRILLLSDVRGQLTLLNQVAVQAKVSYAVCTGNFGFYDAQSASTIDPALLPKVRSYRGSGKRTGSNSGGSSNGSGGSSNGSSSSSGNGSGGGGSGSSGGVDVGELQLCLQGKLRLKVPVYTVWGDEEDVRVVCKFRRGEYKVPNLHIIDELHSHLSDGLRFLGLGGAIDSTKMLDGGAEVEETIAGEAGRMWTTLLQVGQLIKTAKQTYRPDETRIFVTFGNPLLEGFLTILAHAIKADVILFHQTSSLGITSLRENVVNSFESMTQRMEKSAESVQDVWEEVGDQVREMLEEAGELEFLDLMETAIGALNTPPSAFHHSTVWHIGAAPLSASFPRSKSILMQSPQGHSQLGLDLFCSGVDFQRQRNYASRSASRGGNSGSGNTYGGGGGGGRGGGGGGPPGRASGEYRVKVSAKGGWPKMVTVTDVRELFNGTKIEWVYLPREKHGDMTVHFQAAEDLHRAMTKALPNVREIVAANLTVSKLPPAPMTDRAGGGGRSGGRGRGGLRHHANSNANANARK